MKTMVLSLGLALLCLLCVEAVDPGNVRLDKSKITGKWFVTALASNSEIFFQKKDQLKMGTASVMVLGEGEMKVSFVYSTPDGCKKFEGIYKQTGVPGEYYSERGNKTVQVVDTDGETYAIIFASRVMVGKTTHMLKLYTKNPEVSPEIKELFKKLARERSYTDEMIKMLPSHEDCNLVKV